MEAILDDPSKFRKVEFKKTFKEFNYLADKEKEINKLLNAIKGSLINREVRHLNRMVANQVYYMAFVRYIK